jgi:hypothetical protein
MKFDKVKTAECLKQTTPVVDVLKDDYVPETTDDPRVDDHEFAVFNPTLTSNPPAVEGLEIRPSSDAQVEEGKVAKFDAYLKLLFKDGTRKEKKVTCGAGGGQGCGTISWSSSDDALAKSLFMHAAWPSHGPSGCGAFKAGSVTADTTVKVFASYIPQDKCSSDAIDPGETRPIKGDPVEAWATLTIKETCLRVGMDIVLVVDRSGSMLRTDSAGVSRLASAKSAGMALVENANWPDTEQEGTTTSGDYDRVAVLSYAGNKESGSNVETHVKLAATKTSAENGVGDIEVSEECGGQGMSLSTCATGIGGGLFSAYELLKKDGKAGKRKVIILLTDGYENVCETNKYPETIAATIKSHGDRTVSTITESGGTATATTAAAHTFTTGNTIQITGATGANASVYNAIHTITVTAPTTFTFAVASGTGNAAGTVLAHPSAAENAANTIIVAVGFHTLGSKLVKHCDGTSRTVTQFLGTDIASCDLYYTASDTASLITVFQKIHTLICEDNNSGSPCHYIAPPTTFPQVNPCLKDRHSYWGFKNWVVSKGRVDLMGADIWASLAPDNGQFVGLIGNRGTILGSKNIVDLQASGDAGNCQKFYAPFDEQYGGIRSKVPHTLSSGKYELTVSLAGNREVNFPLLGKELCSSVRVSVGGNQAGELNKLGPHAESPDEVGTVSWGFKDGTPRLCTRKLEGAIAEKVITVEPMSDFGSYRVEFETSGGDIHLMIEQYPLGWDTNTHSHTIADSVFKDKGCSEVTNPVSVREYSGFWTGEGFLTPNEKFEKLRHRTSGADEFVGPKPFGVLLGQVLLERIESDGTRVEEFKDDFESENVCP